jgi:aspartyl-tRNA(Asn)/glutamyl-tRNA(Gln) amidotransferase subunit C
MEVNDELIDKLADLAKLEFDATSKENIKKDLQNMIAFVEKLNELDLKGVEPIEYITDEKNVLREDVVIKSISKSDALKNAPLKDSDYFKVPKVLKK